MKIIEQTIKYLDVPFGDAATAEIGWPTGQLRTVAGMMRKYPLTTLDPDNFVMTLEEIGELNPSAEFRVDKKSKTLFATATESDHEKINSLIDQFDGTGREFHVVPLRRLPADAVAATIYNLMAGQKEKRTKTQSPALLLVLRLDETKTRRSRSKALASMPISRTIGSCCGPTRPSCSACEDLLIKLGEIPKGQQDVRPVRFVQPAE